MTWAINTGKSPKLFTNICYCWTTPTEGLLLAMMIRTVILRQVGCKANTLTSMGKPGNKQADNQKWIFVIFM
jgi:hypothetical protein